MKTNRRVLAIVAVVIFFVAIGVAEPTETAPDPLRGGGGQGMGQGQQGQGQRQGGGFFITGRTTFREVIAEGVSREDIEAAIGIGIPNTSRIIRDFCEENNLILADVRQAIEELLARAR